MLRYFLRSSAFSLRRFVLCRDRFQSPIEFGDSVHFRREISFQRFNLERHFHLLICASFDFFLDLTFPFVLSIFQSALERLHFFALAIQARLCVLERSTHGFALVARIRVRKSHTLQLNGELFAFCVTLRELLVEFVLQKLARLGEFSDFASQRLDFIAISSVLVVVVVIAVVIGAISFTLSSVLILFFTSCRCGIITISTTTTL